MRVLRDIEQILRCDLGPSASDLRWTLFPSVILAWIIVLSGGGLIVAFDQQFAEAYAFVHGYTDAEAKLVMAAKFKRVMIALSLLTLCFAINRLYFIVLTLFILLVLFTQLSDYFSTAEFKFSESRYERYRQMYGLELIGVAILFRLMFLASLVWAARDVWRYHARRPKW